MAGRASQTKIVRPIRSGQVTIPAEFRRQLGLTEDSLFQSTLTEGELRLRPVRVRDSRPNAAWLEELDQRFAPIREQASQASEEEVNEAIDAAGRAVREHHA